MPHAELKYSDDLTLPTQQMLAEIEAVILRHDDGAGACKGRAYPAPDYHHSHVTISVSILQKPHRDAAFCQALLDDLEHTLSAMIPVACEFSLGLHFAPQLYVTKQHRPGTATPE